MRFRLGIYIAIVALSAGCASTVPFDGFSDAHAACYAYSYGENGAGTNYEKALRYCREGSLDGNNSSMTLLAELYYFGNGTPKDVESARHYYEMAAALGHPHAQVMVFLIFNRDLYHSSSCEQKLRGLEYLREAAAHGFEKAVELLVIVDEAIERTQGSQWCST
jgi:TPR repeat protein